MRWVTLPPPCVRRSFFLVDTDKVKIVKVVSEFKAVYHKNKKVLGALNRNLMIEDFFRIFEV